MFVEYIACLLHVVVCCLLFVDCWCRLKLVGCSLLRLFVVVCCFVFICFLCLLFVVVVWCCSAHCLLLVVGCWLLVVVACFCCGRWLMHVSIA